MEFIMSIQNLEQLNEMHIDVLKEIGNIGAGNAATSLSQMLNTPVDMTTPTVRILDINDAASALGGPENVVIGILAKLGGDIEGIMNLHYLIACFIIIGQNFHCVQQHNRFSQKSCDSNNKTVCGIFGKFG